jgi:trehalose synthase
MGLEQVAFERRSLRQLGDVIGPPRLAALMQMAESLRVQLRGRAMWHVNSTAAGGGVAEMLRGLLGYVVDAGIEARWAIIRGDDEFFALTKRLHNQLHGVPAGAALDATHAAVYSTVSQLNAAELAPEVRPGDVVVLHDPQTAGLIGPLAARGATVVWRCHVGIDEATPVTEAAWEFLRPYLAGAHAYVFSRQQYRPRYLPASAIHTIRPTIDPFSAKNAELSADVVRAVLVRIGVLDGVATGPVTVAVGDSLTVTVNGSAQRVARRSPAADEPVILQASRWDGLKDMAGVMRAFVDHIAPRGPGYLVLAGPEVAGVADDPEGAVVYAGCVRAWEQLPVPSQDRIMLATLPMSDLRANAVMVNALQRYATVVTQKSLAEGFGLTVAEAMWKARPVVAGRVGGIVDQIATGCGRLVEPTDLTGFGNAVRDLLDHPDLASSIGRAARDHVRQELLADVQLRAWAALFQLIAPPQSGVAGS